MANRQKDYDSTVARIAGNVASGLASHSDLRLLSGHFGAEGLTEWMLSITKLSVAMARAIVSETKLTEPKVEDTP